MALKEANRQRTRERERERDTAGNGARQAASVAARRTGISSGGRAQLRPFSPSNCWHGLRSALAISSNGSIRQHPNATVDWLRSSGQQHVAESKRKRWKTQRRKQSQRRSKDECKAKQIKVEIKANRSERVRLKKLSELKTRHC